MLWKEVLKIQRYPREYFIGNSLILDYLVNILIKFTMSTDFVKNYELFFYIDHKERSIITGYIHAL